VVSKRVYPPLAPENARTLLADLIDLYQLGQRAPLCLFPSASKQYAQVLRKLAGSPDGESRALEAARRTFAGSAGADAEDAYVQRLFVGVDPFAKAPVPFDEAAALGLPSFAELAERVFGPLLDRSEADGGMR
jgi:exonuclease V gamma subunit